MGSDDPIAIVLKIAALERRLASSRPYSPPRESFATKMLGGSSTTVGLVVLAVGIAGLIGYPIGDAYVTRTYVKSEPRTVHNASSVQSEIVVVPVYRAGRQVFLPDKDLIWLPLFGWLLGLGGLILSLFLRRFSRWSAIGLIANLATIFLVLGSILYLNLNLDLEP